jgi:hypothetical protein
MPGIAGFAIFGIADGIAGGRLGGFGRSLSRRPAMTRGSGASAGACRRCAAGAGSMALRNALASAGVVVVIGGGCERTAGRGADGGTAGRGPDGGTTGGRCGNCTPVGGALRVGPRRGGNGGNRRPHVPQTVFSSAFSALQNGQNLTAWPRIRRDR